MVISYRKLILITIFLILIIQLAGCGETLHGISTDIQRVGKGVKTIFIRETE